MTSSIKVGILTNKLIIGGIDMIQTTHRPFRADHVGSFLRPAALKEAREQFNRGDMTQSELRQIENEEIEKLVMKQKEVGLEAVTDGEFRRKWWHLDFIQELNGIRTFEVDAPGLFQGTMTKATVYTVDGKLSFPKDHPFLTDFTFLNELAGDHVAKQTIPGPNMIFYSGVVGSQAYLDNPVYESLDDVATDIIQVYQDAIQAFYDAGCRYLQLDDTSWGALFNDTTRQRIEKSGFSLKEIMQKFADITIEAVAHKPENMTITIHICRGNFKSAWLYEGDYELIAKELFSRVNVDGFFLEFDTERAGDFSPLRYIGNQSVVLGLITTKSSDVENPDKIKKRIEEATKYVPLNQLCLSPQCGFASTEEGNLISEATQWEKLALVKEIANDVWG